MRHFKVQQIETICGESTAICRTRARRRHRWRSPFGDRHELSPAVLRTHRRGDLAQAHTHACFAIGSQSFSGELYDADTPESAARTAIIWKNGTGRTKPYTMKRQRSGDGPSKGRSQLSATANTIHSNSAKPSEDDPVKRAIKKIPVGEPVEVVALSPR